MPNVLTPDCDGIGCELLTLHIDCPVEAFHFELFDRWATLIFESDTLFHQIHIGMGNKEYKDGVEQYILPNGVYVWRVRYSAILEGEEKEFNQSGQLTIIN